MKVAFTLLNKGIPEELPEKNPMNLNGNHIQEHRNFAKKAKWLDASKLNKKSLWNRIYFYNTLPKNFTTQPNLKKF